MATKTIRAKKNPVSSEMVKEREGRIPDLSDDVVNELLKLDIKQGRFLAVSKETFEYYQDDNQTRALTHATREFGFENVRLVDLSEPDGLYRVKIPLRVRSRSK